jgi:molybdate transport system substrate-binding protein
MSINRFIVVIAAGPIVAAAVTVQAAEVRVIGATPTTAVVTQVGQQFERDTGHKVVAQFVSGPVVKREIDGGKPFDLAVSITPVIDNLVKEGKIVAATRADVAYAGVGVGVRAGAPKPDIGTVDAFRKALLNAKSVAHSAEGASGDYFRGLLGRLGIAEQMKPKLRPMSPAALVKAVPSGAAEMIVVTMSVIVGGAAELVGPVPAELQFYNRFAAGVGAKARQPDAAKTLLDALTSPRASAAIKAAGMSPGKP